MTASFTQANDTAIRGKTIAVIGYGSQGRAHALNLRDGGHRVIIGARPGGKAEAMARADGLTVMTPAEAAKQADLLALLTPDMSHKSVYANDIAPNLRQAATLLVAHGFSVLYGQIEPRADLDVVLVAPKGPGDLVRREYEKGMGVPCLFAVHQDASGQGRDHALAYAAGIGGARTGVIETSFKEETETDLFGEQAVLCGGATELVAAGFDTLVAAGYQPEIAYFECLHELKLIVDLLYEGGFAKMHHFISETANYGAVTAGPRVIDAGTRERMKAILDDIQSRRFADAWIAENEAGKPDYDARIAASKAHPIEATGARLRGQMSWLSAGTPAEAAVQAPRQSITEAAE